MSPTFSLQEYGSECNIAIHLLILQQHRFKLNDCPPTKRCLQDHSSEKDTTTLAVLVH
jgi:hypothetical protein